MNIQKSSKNHRQIASRTIRERAARKKLEFSAPGQDLAWTLGTLTRPWKLPGALFGFARHPWGLSGRLRDTPGHPKTLPRHPQDALRTLLGATRHPEWSRERLWLNFGYTGARPRTDFGSIFHLFAHRFSNQAVFCLSEKKPDVGGINRGGRHEP